MSLLVIGLDHRTAPVDLRERLSVERAQLPHALAQLADYVPQSVILSTCNRTEVYTYAANDTALAGRVNDFLTAYSGVPEAQLERHTYRIWEADCVAHLFRVAGGLESMIVGERQILGQVRAAFSIASQAGYVKNPLTRVFHDALRAGRRVHRETAIGQHSRSVSRAAVHLARGLFDRLDNRRALVIGAGDAGRMVARALADAGVRQITVANRTPWRADDLARDLGGITAPFTELPSAIAAADLVISSTGSPGYVVDRAMMQNAILARNAPEPIMLIDIAVPRDIDPAAANLPQVRLFDIDALGQAAETSRDDWDGEVSRANAVIAAELTRFSEWWQSSDTMELIVAMRQRAEAMRQKEVARTLQLLHADSDSEMAERLHAMTGALVKKLLHQPTIALRSGSNPADYRAALRLFGPDGPNGPDGMARGRR